MPGTSEVAQAIAITRALGMLGDEPPRPRAAAKRRLELGGASAEGASAQQLRLCQAAAGGGASGSRAAEVIDLTLIDEEGEAARTVRPASRKPQSAAVVSVRSPVETLDLTQDEGDEDAPLGGGGGGGEQPAAGLATPAAAAFRRVLSSPLTTPGSAKPARRKAKAAQGGGGASGSPCADGGSDEEESADGRPRGGLFFEVSAHTGRIFVWRWVPAAGGSGAQPAG